MTTTELINKVRENEGNIESMEELADAINAADDWCDYFYTVIENNGWVDDTAETFGICHIGNKYLEFDKNLQAIIVEKNNISPTHHGEAINMRTYDIQFNNENDSNSKGFKESLQYCKDYIAANKHDDDSYFADYAGGTVSIVCNETGEVAYFVAIPSFDRYVIVMDEERCGGETMHYSTNDIEEARRVFRSYCDEADRKDGNVQVYLDQWNDAEGEDFENLEYYAN